MNEKLWNRKLLDPNRSASPCWSVVNPELLFTRGSASDFITTGVAWTLLLVSDAKRFEISTLPCRALCVHLLWWLQQWLSRVHGCAAPSVLMLDSVMWSLCYGTKLGSPHSCTVKPVYWHQVVVKESAAFNERHQTRSPRQLMLKKPKLSLIVFREQFL